MDIWKFIEIKREQAKGHKNVLKMLNIIELLIIGCVYHGCLKCPYSYGTNIKKLSCQFNIKPKDIVKDVTPDNWGAFCDEIKEIVFSQEPTRRQHEDETTR